MTKQEFQNRHGLDDKTMEELEKIRIILGVTKPIRVVTRTPEEWAKNKWIEP